MESYGVKRDQFELKRELLMRQTPPSEIRKLIRTKRLIKLDSTSGLCEGYKQANITIVDKRYAADFRKFCELNQGPLPLLYVSNTGVFSAPPLATDSDIRTDMLSYQKITRGCRTEAVDNLDDAKDLENWVTFYIGCSFSFEKVLLANRIPVRNLEQNKVVAMYTTNVRCVPVGPFDCTMVVTMRPVPENQIDILFKVTQPLTDVHGAPIHIGSPEELGISDIDKPQLGDATLFHSGDVPVFWCCGVTCNQAVKSARMPLAFTHTPGKMFLTDVQSEYKVCHTPQVTPKVVKRDGGYEVLSESTHEYLASIDNMVARDLGKRGITALHCHDDFASACFHLDGAAKVMLITGFPCPGRDVPEENDGPPGALAIAAMLQALKKEVILVVDVRAKKTFQKLVDLAQRHNYLLSNLPVLTYSPAPGLSAKQSAYTFISGHGCDVLLAIERSGTASDGKHYHMNGKETAYSVDHTDDLFMVAYERGITTIGIGDGGNELGMGKVTPAVRRHIPHGNVIACVTPCDHLIVAGVSNWGGWGLAFGLYALRVCPVRDRFQRHAIGLPCTYETMKLLLPVLPSYERELELLDIVENMVGMRDGIKKESGRSVDGMVFAKEHKIILNDLNSLVDNINRFLYK